MASRANWKRSLWLWFAVGASLSAGGCSPSSPNPLSGGVPIPPLDSYVTTPCSLPGVTANPKVDAVRHRVALVDCEARRAAAVINYDEVRAAFGVK